MQNNNNNNNNNASKFKEEFTVIELTHTCTAFQEAFREDFEYSDFFRDHQLQPQHIGDVRRDYIHFVDSNWDLKAVVLIQVSYNQYTELQSFRGTKIQNTVKKPLKATESRFRHFLTHLPKSCNG